MNRHPPQSFRRSASPGSADPRFGFAALAQRISGWTSNCLATVLVLVGGISLGWQVLAWWREAADDRPASPAMADADFGGAQAPRSLELHTHAGPMLVDHVVGDQPAVRRLMRERCLAAAGSFEPAGPEGPGEQRLLAQLARQQPSEATSRLMVYEPESLPVMTVAVSRASGRLTAWSFASSGSNGTWSCYTFYPAAAVAGEAASMPGVNR